jgi:glutaredoxin
MKVFLYMHHTQGKGGFMKWFPVVFTILLCFVFPAGGDIYTWVDENGVKHFATEPPPDAASVERRDEVKHSSERYDLWEEQRKSKQDKMLEKGQSGDAISKKEPRVTRRMTKGSADVVMYTTPTCGYCVRARAFFAKHNIAFTEYDVKNDRQARERFKKLNGSGVPLIFVGNNRVPGFNEQLLRRLLHIK